MARTASNYVNYQERATEFSPGDIVVLFGSRSELAGRVTSVWPAIGMVDVEFATGNRRLPVEDIVKVEPDKSVVIPPFTDSTPGGPAKIATSASVERIAHAFVKKSLYWSGPDRKYRAPATEVATGHYKCPKCKARGIDSTLRPAVYKRRDGVSEKLLGCGECLFLIKRSDIINCPENSSSEDEV